MSDIKTSRKTDIVKVILAILAVLLGTYIFVDPGKTELKVDPAAISKIDSLQKINDSLSKDNLELDSLLENYNDVIDELDSKLNTVSKSRADIQAYYTKKLKEIEDRIQEPSDLDSFFMERYQNDSDE